nr:nitrogenase iron-molybdenum cofactor biosynthesis protein NifN [uncultured Desulfuromonas sp.]
MGEIIHKNTKPLQVNPFRLTQPMGAALAFLGVDQCMPLMHGAQGCTSFTKVFMTRHFCEPIAIQTTAVSDAVAVLDGGDYSISEAVKNITGKISPALVGLHTTGLPETKGDDIRGVSKLIDFPLVYVNSPDYEGAMESGWALTTKALIDQLTAEQSAVNDRKVVLLPHVSLTPLEVEKIQQFIAAFGLDVVAVPDLSTSLDGHLGDGQAALSKGGVSVEAIRELADAGHVLTIGDSMRDVAKALQKKNPAVRHQHFSHVNGLDATDAFAAALLEISGLQRPPELILRWRKRLQDAMLDSHFSLGQTRFILAGEPDQMAALSQSLYDAGGRIPLCVVSTDSPILDKIKADKVVVGDLEDLEAALDETDMVLSNFHVERLVHPAGKGLMLRGMPNWEQVGNALKFDVLYEGGAYFLCEAANLAEEWRVLHVRHRDEEALKKGCLK